LGEKLSGKSTLKDASKSSMLDIELDGGRWRARFDDNGDSIGCRSFDASGPSSSSSLNSSRRSMDSCCALPDLTEAVMSPGYSSLNLKLGEAECRKYAWWWWGKGRSGDLFTGLPRQGSQSSLVSLSAVDSAAGCSTASGAEDSSGEGGPESTPATPSTFASKSLVAPSTTKRPRDGCIPDLGDDDNGDSSSSPEAAAGDGVTGTVAELSKGGVVVEASSPPAAGLVLVLAAWRALAACSAKI
jgi:hypothetical protein